MATRDLTVSYMRLRSALHRKAPGRENSDGSSGTGLLGAPGGGSVDAGPLVMAGASPIYVEMVTEIQNDMNSIQSKSEFSKSAAKRASDRGG